MAPHSSTLAWKIPWMEEPGRLQSIGSLRVRHDWVTSRSLFTFMHWRMKWQPTQCSCLENPRDGGAWWAAIYGVAQSPTWLKQLSSSSNYKYEFSLFISIHQVKEQKAQHKKCASWETSNVDSQFRKMHSKQLLAPCLLCKRPLNYITHCWLHTSHSYFEMYPPIIWKYVSSAEKTLSPLPTETILPNRAISNPTYPTALFKLVNRYIIYTQKEKGNRSYEKTQRQNDRFKKLFIKQVYLSPTLPNPFETSILGRSIQSHFLNDKGND